MITGAFVGRERELARLTSALERARRGRGEALLIGGEGGIGKTALIRRFLGGDSASDARVVWGTAPVPAGDRIPYAPWLEILRAVAAEAPADLVESLRPDLGPMLPWPHGETGPAGDAETARHRQLDAVRALLEEVAATRPPLVVVVEDLHWADTATLAAFSFLIHQLRMAPVLIVGTYRSDELDRAPELRRLVVELTRLEHVSHVELTGLEESELAAIAPARDEARAIARRAAGNPYLFGLLLEREPSATDGLPATVREVIAQRLGVLPPHAADVVRLVAIAGAAATGRLMAVLRPGRDDETRDALRHLTHGRVLERPQAASEPYEFHHPLLKEAVLDELLPDERAELHRRVVVALEADPSLVPAGAAGAVEIAIHWAAADESERSLPALLAGAEYAQAAYAFELAHEFLERALTLAEKRAEASPDERLELAVRTAEAAYLAGAPRRAVELAEWAIARRRFDAAREARVLERVGWYHLAAGDVDRSLDALQRALSATVDDELGSRVQASYGRALMLAGRYDDARPALEHAIRLARTAGSASDESRALSALGVVLVRLGDVEAGTARLEAARRLDEQRALSLVAPRPSRIGYLIGSMLDRASVLEGAGRLESAAAEARGALAAAERLGGPGVWGVWIATRTARELFLLGRWPETDEAISEGLRGADGPERALLLATRTELAAARGDLDAAVAAAAEAQAAADGQAPPAVLVAIHLALGQLALARNRSSEAVDVVEQAAALMAGSEDRILSAEVAALGLRAYADRAAEARIRRAGGELERIRERGLVLIAQAGVPPPMTGVRPGSVVGTGRGTGRWDALRLQCEAELTRMDGRADPDLWAAAAVAYEALGERLSAATARWREAEALFVGRGERSRAEKALRSSAAAAQALGAAPLHREVASLARRSRVDLAPTGTPGSATDADPAKRLRDELGLSERELEVLALLAEGRTNRQIAHALFITEKTAAHHVSSILSKLGLSSRAEAAAAAHRLGLPDALTQPARE